MVLSLMLLVLFVLALLLLMSLMMLLAVVVVTGAVVEVGDGYVGGGAIATSRPKLLGNAPGRFDNVWFIFKLLTVLIEIFVR